MVIDPGIVLEELERLTRQLVNLKDSKREEMKAFNEGIKDLENKIIEIIKRLEG